MNAINGKNAVRVLMACSLALLVAATSSMAWGRRGDGYRGGSGGGYHGGGSGYHDGYRGHGWHGFNRSYYWGGFYIGPQWFGGPTVVVAGVPYYYYGGYYYAPAGDYLALAQPPVTQPQVVAEPQTADQPAAQAQAPEQPTAEAQPQTERQAAVAGNTGDSVTINVPNASGGFTPVILVKTDKGYAGPQGEFYPNHPTVAQLKVLYGGNK